MQWVWWYLCCPGFYHWIQRPQASETHSFSYRKPDVIAFVARSRSCIAGLAGCTILSAQKLPCQAVAPVLLTYINSYKVASAQHAPQLKNPKLYPSIDSQLRTRHSVCCITLTYHLPRPGSQAYHNAMIPHSESRLTIITAFLVLQSLVFVFKLLIFNKRVRRRSYYLPLRQLLGPTLIALLGTAIIPITFNHAGRYITNAEKQCSANVNGDIAGEGTQIATWAQVGVLLVISGLGSFHISATGAKEIGAGLLLTHISLAIAILIQMRLRTLNSANAVVGAMILDAQNVGLSIQLAAKETLAARWQVRVVVLAQVFGFVVVPVLVTNFARGAFAGGNCSCLTVF